MLRCPLQHKSEDSWWKGTSNHLQVLDLNDSLLAGIDRVKMGRGMVVVVHVNGNTEELGNPGQGGPSGS
jgi:hypothetical protein